MQYFLKKLKNKKKFSFMIITVKILRRAKMLPEDSKKVSEF